MGDETKRKILEIWEKVGNDCTWEDYARAIIEASHNADIDWLKAHNLESVVDRLAITTEDWKKFQATDIFSEVN